MYNAITDKEGCNRCSPIDEIIEKLNSILVSMPDDFRIKQVYSILDLIEKLSAENSQKGLRPSDRKIWKRIMNIPKMMQSYIAEPRIVYGRFYQPEKRKKECRIELYYNNIKSACVNAADAISLSKCVLAHEFFHYRHYCDVKSFGGQWNAGKKASSLLRYKAVKESLARLFEYEFSLKYASPSVKDIEFEMLQKDRFPNWPYAGGQYLGEPYFNDTNSKVVFDLIYNLSKTNMETAYSLLEYVVNEKRSRFQNDNIIRNRLFQNRH